MTARRFTLMSAEGKLFDSAKRGQLGGNGRLHIYGRLSCPSALRALPRGYAKHRVFFADEASAIAVGYRPCSVCMREAYTRWKVAVKT